MISFSLTSLTPSTTQALSLAVLLNKRADSVHTPTECDGCGLQQTYGRKFSRCGGCLRVRYCCKACQMAAWKAHKSGCK